MKLIFVFLIFITFTVTADKKAEESIKKQLLEHYEKMSSKDENVRKEALKAILPDEKTFKLFLTDEEMNLIKEPMKMAIQRMLAANEKIKEELTKGGKVKSIKLVSIKEKHPDSKFLKRIKFPAYSAIITYEKTTAGQSTYFLVDGKLKWLNGLESMDRGLEQLKKMQKK